MMRARSFSLLAIALTAVVLLSGCFAAGPRLDEQAAQLATELEDSDVGVSDARVLAPSSFTGSLSITVTMEDAALDFGPAISADSLKKLLRLVGQGGSSMGVGSAKFYLKDAQGTDVSMTAAVDELGLRETLSGRSLSLTAGDLKNLASLG